MVDRAAVARARPPAWYPDPRDPGRLRRWDGRTWTADTRPFPSWLRTLQLAPGPQRPPVTNLAIRRLWASSLVCLVLALVLLDVLGRGGAFADHVADRRFVAAADAACSRTEALAIAPNAQPLRGTAEVNRVRRIVDAQDRLVDDLRSLPVANADQPAVDRWLAAWDAWTTAGHRYAQASAEGDVARARQVSEHSRRAKMEIDAFATANGMPHCVQFRRP
jgi:hypothetical protein